MRFRTQIASGLLSNARKIGESLGCEPVIEVSEHSIKMSMEVPDKSKRAWDSDLYESGQLFYEGYANPVKLRVNQTQNPKQPDTLESPKPLPDGGEEKNLEVIPSYRYRQHMDQHLLSQLVNPTQQWTLLLYAILGVGGLVVLSIIITMYVTGGF